MDTLPPQLLNLHLNIAMPTIERNLSLWANYNWEQEGEEWSSAWGGSEFQWQWTLLPRIGAFIPAATILELGPGFGRWTNYLKDYCDQLIGVDLSENCIRACQAKFSAYPHRPRRSSFLRCMF